MDDSEQCFTSVDLHVDPASQFDDCPYSYLERSKIGGKKPSKQMNIYILHHDIFISQQ